MNEDIDSHSISQSPSPSDEQQTHTVRLMTFNSIVDELLDGKKVTREEWNNKQWYGVINGGILSIHKAGEEKDMLRPWILNDGDLMGEDWFVI